MRTMTQWLLQIIVILFFSSLVYAHSLPTHVNLTNVTVEFLAQKKVIACNKQQQENLKKLLRIGTIQEDDYLDPKNITKLGRFNFHFMPRLQGSLSATCSSLQWAGLDDLEKHRVRCSYTITPKAANVIRLFARNTHPKVGTFRITNTHTYGAAVRDARKPHKGKKGTGNKQARSFPAFGQGFEHLGYVLHLLQDLTSPAHSRTDPHGYIHGHYSLEPTAFGSPDPMEWTKRGREMERQPRRPSGNLINKRPDALFVQLNRYVRRNFFSADTVLKKPGPANLSTIQGRSAAGCLAPGTICKDTHGRSVAFHDPRRAGPDYRPHLLGGAGAGVNLPTGSLTVSYKVANAQWRELGPLAVRYGASLIHYYIQHAEPRMPSACLEQ